MNGGRPAVSAVRAWLELFRVPNVFTALADVMAGFLLTHASFEPWPILALLSGASALIYTAGIVLNDVFDVDIDRRERPSRPLPSARIALRSGRIVGFAMLFAGIASAAAASMLAKMWLPAAIGAALAAAVLAYDAAIKRTAAGPLNMGLCRALNLLLGMSAAIGAGHAAYLAPAVGLGVYIAGVTWFARNEAHESNRVQLGAATLVIVGGMAIMAALPAVADAQLPPVSQPRYAWALGARWYVLWTMLAGLTTWRAVRAIGEPTPWRVQQAVKHCILTIIVLDAAVVFSARGMPWAVAVLLLLVPAMFLGRWIYST